MNNPKPKPGTDAKSAIQATNIFKELHGHFIEDLEVGMTDFYSRTITEADIVMFAGITGDMNPVHMNREFAEQTQFGGPIAHGMLTASFISTVIGTKLPGPGCIYVAQNLRFKGPVKVGDTVIAKAEITELIPEKKRALFKTQCFVGDTVVIDGEAQIMVPTRS